ATFTSTRARRTLPPSQGSSCSRTASRPGLASPTAFSIPPANSATRGAGAPRRCSGVTALVTIPPRASRSITPTPRARSRRCRKPGGRDFGTTRRTAGSGSGGASPTPRRRGDRELALELEQVGNDAVGDRARDLVLTEARGEERAV